MRLLFAGTPEVALPSLEALLDSRHEVVAVLTRPAAPAGRGRRTAVSPVARLATERGVEVLSPSRPSDPAFLERLRAITPDCCPVVGYGGLIPQSALDVPPNGWVNLHFSLLPAWRGAAPVQHALLAGDEVTGATTFRLVKELDAGPTFGMVTETVRPDDTTGSLGSRLAEHGARLLVATVDGIEDGAVEPREQPTTGVSLAPKLSVDDARIDWSAPAFGVDRRIRACTPEPGAWTLAGGQRLVVGPVVAAGDERLAPGVLSIGRRDVVVGTATDPVRLGDVKPAGKGWMPAAAWARGLRQVPPRLGE